MTRIPFVWLPLFSAFVFSSSDAQVVEPPAAPVKAEQPINPTATVPPTTYRSAFSAYRASGDDAVVSWREANDLVGRIGGWRFYAREAQQLPAGAPATVVPSPPRQ